MSNLDQPHADSRRSSIKLSEKTPSSSDEDYWTVKLNVLKTYLDWDRKV
jgi:hypothetical protein